jgi:hypothetical protein
MRKTLRAVVRNGRVDLLEPGELPEGARLLVTILSDEEREFWLRASETSLADIWDNAEDDVYAELLEE